LREVAEWVAAYRQFWEQRFDRLEDYLQNVQAPRQRKGKSHGRTGK
jgi:hypothetical protein